MVTASPAVESEVTNFKRTACATDLRPHLAEVATEFNKARIALTIARPLLLQDLVASTNCTCFFVQARQHRYQRKLSMLVLQSLLCALASYLIYCFPQNGIRERGSLLCVYSTVSPVRGTSKAVP